MEGKPSLINAERVAALGRLGFSWSLRVSESGTAGSYFFCANVVVVNNSL
jgi:hypothetical protein